MQLTDRQEALLEFVKQEHGDQQRKYSDEPYWKHVVRVANIASKYLKDGVEVAFCHDLLEDTACTEKQLYNQLIAVGYPEEEASVIREGVVELTDVYIKENYPELNRRERKKREAERLWETSYLAQSVKYADLIDNMNSIVDGEPGFARVFVREGVDILKGMRDGNIHLLIDCCYAIKKAKLELNLDAPRKYW
ncbi:MAG: hypothetical protein WD059_06270 [Balneolaceae bacterium]